MKILQYKGPFTTSDVIKIEPVYDRTYVHIGIQIPERQPIAYLKESALYPDIKIGEDQNSYIQYRVNETGILEFDETIFNSIVIGFSRNLPTETIIDVAYKDAEDI